MIAFIWAYIGQKRVLCSALLSSVASAADDFCSFAYICSSWWGGLNIYISISKVFFPQKNCFRKRLSFAQLLLHLPSSRVSIHRFWRVLFCCRFFPSYCQPESCRTTATAAGCGAHPGNDMKLTFVTYFVGAALAIVLGWVSHGSAASSPLSRLGISI